MWRTLKFCSNDLLDNNEITASVTEDIIIRAQTEVLRRKKIELYPKPTTLENTRKHLINPKKKEGKEGNKKESMNVAKRKQIARW